MVSDFFRVGIVAPLLLWGIWIVAQESLFDRYSNLSELPRPEQAFRRRSTFIQISTVAIVFLLLASLLVGFVSMRFIASLLLTFSIYPWYTRSKEREKERRYRETLDAELPSFIQIISILVATGISPIRALSLVSENSRNQLAREFAHIVRDVNQGSSMIVALDHFSSRAQTRLARRFAGSVAAALERGSPLAQVLMDFVRDARNERRNQIQRRAGRAEIALMIPVVFLILPISVLFALWPSLSRLAEMV